ncbi:unnamed protein product [Mycena citricolor]|uniref:HTH CENPB-type domain-containing protein n=1 Tax=Mycena citricolor TaxID=2018698 RepID=A0AAD2HAQ8_9AGAR|nr:unnamed protein product [Mycena citricolor]
MPVEPTAKSHVVRAWDHDPTEARANAATRVKPGPKLNGTHRSSAILGQEGRKNLTNYDWLQVIQYAEKNPGTKQKAVIEFFASRSNAKGGKLFFTQGALSKHLNPEKKAALLKLAAENSAALLLKRERVVTSPKVDRGLGLWALDMEQKNRAVTGAMLIEQRKRLEIALNVPEECCLRGTGWLKSFKKAHGLSERHRHGEASSVDLAAVEVERKRLIDILSGMQMLENAWNHVMPLTIANCWTHTKITPKETDEWEEIFVDPNAPDSSNSESEEPKMDKPAALPEKPASVKANSDAWDVILEFAMTKMLLPQAEQGLERVLGTDYYPKDWNVPLDAVMACEGNSIKTELAVWDLMAAQTEAAAKGPLRRFACDRHLRAAEDALSDTIQTLATERCIRGILPLLDDILYPLIERQEPGSSVLGFADRDNTNEIIQHMCRVDQEELEAEIEEEEEPEFSSDKKEAIAAIKLLEQITQHRPDLDSTLTLGPQLRKMHIGLTKEIEQGKKQMELSQYFK